MPKSRSSSEIRHPSNPPTHDIILVPAASAKPKIRDYTQDQLALIEELRVYANTLLLPESDPYYPREKKWLEDERCIPRYMRASKWKLEEGRRRIKSTLEWRRDYKPDLIPADEVKVEAETGKLLISGFDNEGRPILYLRPGLENTQESPRQIRHLVFHIERAIDLMPPHQDSMVCLVDYRSATLRTTPSISNARHFLSIVQNHYVETLGRAIVVNLPTLLTFFYKAIAPFLDPVTRDKMRFNPNLLDLIPPEHLDATLQGGTYNYEFDHEIYWKQLCDSTGVRPDGTRYEPELKVRAAVTMNGNGKVNGQADANEDDSIKSTAEPESSASDSVHPPAPAEADPHPSSTASASHTEPSLASAPISGTPPISTDSQEPMSSKPNHAVDFSALQQMRANTIAKVAQNQANLERNEAAGFGTGQQQQQQQSTDPITAELQHARDNTNAQFGQTEQTRLHNEGGSGGAGEDSITAELQQARANAQAELDQNQQTMQQHENQVNQG